jgi:hypothetical protein
VARVPLRVFDRAAQRDRQSQFFGDAPQGKFRHEERLLAALFDPLGFERNQRVSGSVEEVRRPQMIIPLLHSGVHALDLNRAARPLR